MEGLVSAKLVNPVRSRPDTCSHSDPRFYLSLKMNSFQRITSKAFEIFSVTRFLVEYISFCGWTLIYLKGLLFFWWSFGACWHMAHAGCSSLQKCGLLNYRLIKYLISFIIWTFGTFESLFPKFFKKNCQK